MDFFTRKIVQSLYIWTVEGRISWQWNIRRRDEEEIKKIGRELEIKGYFGEVTMDNGKCCVYFIPNRNRDKDELTISLIINMEKKLQHTIIYNTKEIEKLKELEELEELWDAIRSNQKR